MIIRRNTKGLSSIIATLLIILLVLVVIAIVWVVVVNVIKKGADEVSLGKFTVNMEIVDADKINNTYITATIKRNPGKGEIAGIVFVVYDADNSELARYNIPMRELEQRDFNIVLFVLDAYNVKKLSIAPIFILESGKESIGDIEDEWIFNENMITGCTSPLQCNDGYPCTTDACSGGTCTHIPITSCIHGDGCCPVGIGCNSGNDNDCSSSPSSPVPNTWVPALIGPANNGGFEFGNLNNWYTNGAYFVVTTTSPQAGSYAADYNLTSNINYYIQWDIDLIAYATQIDAGSVRINASGWGRSLQYPSHDLTRIQFIFLNSGGTSIGTVYDSGYISNGAWWKAEVSNYPVPAGTRYLRVWGNSYDPDGSISGSIDSFSVALGYF
jgi:hypothetical protein